VVDYTEIARELQAEAEQITRAQQKLQRRLNGLLEAIKAIEILAQESDEPIMEPLPMSADEEQGFTDSVRAILRANPVRGFAAVDIRNLMLEREPRSDASAKVLLIHTHNTLKRLFRQGEVVEVQMPEGRTGYRWKNTTPVVDLMESLKKSLAQMENKPIQPMQPRKAIADQMAENRKRKEERMNAAMRLLELDNQRIKEGKKD
jgi:hypothetical protein